MLTLKSLTGLLLLVVPLLANNFPPYLKKCKNDEHLNECFLKSAQAGISYIMKGDAKFGIPSVYPIIANSTSLAINDLKMEVNNLKIYLSPDIFVVEARWDTHKKHIFIKNNYNRVSWDFDVSFEGSFLGQDITGHGHAKLLYENGWFTNDFDYDIVDVDGTNHAVIKNGKSEHTMEKITFLFEELTNGYTVDPFINKNWKQFEEAFHSQINSLLVFPLSSWPFSAIFKSTPVEELFD